MTHEAIRRNYDRLSRWYDWFAGSEKRFTDAGLRLLDPRPGERILEIGSGTGHALAHLADAGGRITGLDLSAGMLSRARHRVSRSGSRRVDFCQGDALALPFPSRTFHGIFLSFTLELFAAPDISRVLDECYRVLKPVGRLGVVALAREKRTAVRMYEWFHRHWPQVVDCRPIYVHTALIRAGFEIQEAQRMTMWGLPVEIVTAQPK
jgi:demethylmenaquinone methyltransferase/2-methoxy-6-polyprenyl-1,4-benzoquinol methylase